MINVGYALLLSYTLDLIFIDDVKGFFHQPMQRTVAEGWVFRCSPQKLLGPRNILQKPALVALTRIGMIRVLSQGQDNGWQHFKAELEHIGSPQEILTHAAMCPEKIIDKSVNEQGQYLHLHHWTGLTLLRQRYTCCNI